MGEIEMNQYIKKFQQKYLYSTYRKYEKKRKKNVYVRMQHYPWKT